jgi:uncharacterized protein YndB with AHSA1/START domain
MTVLTLQRKFSADAETVFAYVTETEHLLRWWGPETITIGENDLDLSRIGPWSSVMVNAEGVQYKVTGKVISVDPPKSVEFTWAWHDDDDQRGHESVVRFEITPMEEGGVEIAVIHSGLENEESIKNHNEGWTSSLVKLERQFG